MIITQDADWFIHVLAPRLHVVYGLEEKDDNTAAIVLINAESATTTPQDLTGLLPKDEALRILGGIWAHLQLAVEDRRLHHVLISIPQILAELKILAPDDERLVGERS